MAKLWFWGVQATIELWRVRLGQWIGEDSRHWPTHPLATRLDCPDWDPMSLNKNDWKTWLCWKTEAYTNTGLRDSYFGGLSWALQSCRLATLQTLKQIHCGVTQTGLSQGTQSVNVWNVARCCAIFLRRKGKGSLFYWETWPLILHVFVWLSMNQGEFLMGGPQRVKADFLQPCCLDIIFSFYLTRQVC